MSRVLAKDTIPAVSRWEPPALNNGFVATTSEAATFAPATFTQKSANGIATQTLQVNGARAPRLLPPEEIELLTKAARDEGFAVGHKEGVEKGFLQGQRDGLAKGQEEGRKQGIAEGKQEGLTRGLEEGRRDGQTKGQEQGLREGLAKGDAEVKAKLARLEQLLRLLDEPLADLDAVVEEQLVALAIVVARQVVRRELRTHPGEIVPVVHEALASLPMAHRHVRLFLNPEDMPLVRAALKPEESEQGVRLVEDTAVMVGGCRIETDASRIDATVESRLDQVVARLLGSREGSHEHDGL